MIVLGLHGGVTLGQHEPGAALVIDGQVAAACEEERYLRIKSAYGHLPHYSIKACLREAGVQWEDVDLVVTPGLTYDHFDTRIRAYLRHIFGSCPRLERIHHQRAHLSAAFYGSGMEDALVLSLDASGDGACGMLAHATRADGISVLETLPTNRSIGFFYTLMTYYLGFTDGDEYKVMGLAPYGQPTVDLGKIIKLAAEGWDFDWSFVRSDPPLRSPFEPMYAAKIADALGHPPRQPDAPLENFHRDVARSAQAMFEECLLALAKRLRAMRPNCPRLCYAGGVALNCAANRLLEKAEVFEEMHVSPVSSDRGLALGCAYHGAAMSGDAPQPLGTVSLGSSYNNAAIRAELEGNGVACVTVEDPAAAAADLLAQDKIIGWHQGRAEAGARALGNRSILARCETPDIRDRVNARIKYREGFRPFAPSAMAERASERFVTGGRDYPHMCVTVDAQQGHAENMASVVHVDGTARLQTVRRESNPLYHDLLQACADRTGTPVVLNTSFNLKGQPIVETPRDALMTFFGCGLDALIVGDCLVTKPQ